LSVGLDGAAQGTEQVQGPTYKDDLAIVLEGRLFTEGGIAKDTLHRLIVGMVMLVEDAGHGEAEGSGSVANVLLLLVLLAHPQYLLVHQPGVGEAVHLGVASFKG